MRPIARLSTVLLSLCFLAGCAVPTGGDPEAIASSDVPYGLLSPSSTPMAASSSPVRDDRPRVYLVGPGELLTPSGRDVHGTDLRDRLRDLLRELGAGPTAGERDDELTTALPPGVQLTVAAVEDGLATIDLAGPGEAPSGDQSRLAVAQIVLTATSLPDVRAVLLTQDGAPLEAPLPTGELTSEPLEASDYERLADSPPP